MTKSSINGEHLNSGKDQLNKTLQLVQNKLKNHIVRTSLDKYLSGTRLLSDFEKIINVIFDSIEKLDEDSIKNINDPLNTFLVNTENENKIYLYHVKIIDSINFVIDYAKKRLDFKEENNDSTSSKTLQSKSRNSFIKNIELAETQLINYLLDIGYPRSSIKIDIKLNQSKLQPDIIIKYEETILALIEIKNSKAQRSQDIGQLAIYYFEILKTQTFLPRLFIVYIKDDLQQPYEYNISNQGLTKLQNFPSYLDLVNKFNEKNSVSNIEMEKIDLNEGTGEPAELGALNLFTVGSTGNTIGCYRIGSGWTYHAAPYNLTSDTYSILIEFNNEPSANDKSIADSNIYAYEMLKFGKSGHDLSMKASNILHIWGTNTTAGATWMDSVDNSGASDLLIWNYTPTIHMNADFNSKGHQQSAYLKDAKGRVIGLSLNITSTNSPALQTNIYASFQKDNPHEDDDDSLEINEDINAFAKLIAYKDLQTPLSIGLFGKWGSGKSFFMKKLDQKINMLAKDTKDQAFCNNVVSIEFNAWHYSDTNLWASLVSHIFTKLHEFLEEKNRKEKTIFEELESSKKLISEKENELKKIQTKQKNINTELERINTEKHSNLAKFTKSKAIGIVNRILERDDIKQEISKIKGIVDFTNITDLNELKEAYQNLSTFKSVIKNFSYLLKHEKGFVIFGSFSIVLFCMAFYYLPHVVNILQDLKDNILLPVLGVISSWWLLIKPYINRLTSYTVPMKTLMSEWNLYKKQELEKQSEEEILFLRSQEELELQEIELKKDLYKESIKLLQIEEDIEDIKSGKYLASFIEGRSNSNDYKEHLGLISLVRDDFEKLTTEITKHKVFSDDKQEIVIDRIILYIDDLDRCQPEKVVQVLEAVHLLLAFELFVVVVGVDTRWLQGSLNITHQNFQDNELKITPKQYLEKIFQIPFMVKPMNEDNKKALVEQLLSQDIKLDTEYVIDNADNKGKRDKNVIEQESSHVLEKDDLTFKSSESPKQKKEELTEDIEIEYQNQTKPHVQLRLTAEEVNYITQLADKIGNTPRTIKRFINIYRVIRSHHIINEIISNFSQEYPIIILLLCEVFGDTYEGESFLEVITNEQKSFYDTYKLENMDSYTQLQEFIGRFQFDVD